MHAFCATFVPKGCGANASRDVDPNAPPCPPGFYCPPQPAPRVQLPCEPGVYCAGGDTSASGSGWCSPGYFRPGGSVAGDGAPTGGACAKGFSCVGRAVARTGEPTGGLCPGGYWCGAGAAFPIVGAAGFFLPPGSVNALGDPAGGPAPRGHYAPIGSAAAHPCPLGTTTRAPGASSSAACSAGAFCPPGTEPLVPLPLNA